MLYGTGLLLRLFQFVTTLILARILTPADYGIVALAGTVVGVLDTMSDLQVGGSIVRAAAIDNALLDTAFTITLGRGLLTGLILVVVAHPIAVAFRDIRLAPVLYALACASVINGVHNPYFSLYERNLQFKQESWRAAFAAVAGSAVGITAAFVLRSYWALVAGTIARALISMVMSYVQTPGRPSLSLKRFKEIFSFGGWLTLIGLIDYANSRVDYALIGRGLNNATLGAYHIGQQITLMSTGDVVGPLSRAIFPAFSMFVNDEERLRSSYRRAQTVIMGLALPIGIGTSVLGRELILVLVGSRWALAEPVVQWLAPLVALQTLAVSTDSLAFALGKTGILFRRTITIFAVRATLMVIGFSLGGFMGIIYARLLSGTFYLFYHLALAGRMTSSPFWTPIVAGWRSLISAAVMWAALWLLPKFSHVHGHDIAATFTLLMHVCLGAFTYLVCHVALWRLVGCPEGFESRILQLAKRLATRTNLLRQVFGN